MTIPPPAEPQHWGELTQSQVEDTVSRLRSALAAPQPEEPEPEHTAEWARKVLGPDAFDKALAVGLSWSMSRQKIWQEFYEKDGEESHYERSVAWHVVANLLREREAKEKNRQEFLEAGVHAFDALAEDSRQKAEQLRTEIAAVSTPPVVASVRRRVRPKPRVIVDPESVSPSPPETAASFTRPQELAEHDEAEYRKLLDLLLEDANSLRMAGEHDAADEALSLLAITATYCKHLGHLPDTARLLRRCAKSLEDWYDDTHARVDPKEMP